MDTNILVYAADRDSPSHEQARSVLERHRRGSSAWYLTWGIAYEFLRVVTHARILRRPWSTDEAVPFLAALLASPAAGLLVPTRRHLAVLREVTTELPALRGSIMHDLTTAVLMREHGIRTIYTRDTHFRRFAFLEVVDPLTA